MTAPGGEVVAAREAVLKRSLALLLARGRHDTVPALKENDAALYFACRRLTRAVNANLARQPRGWRDDDRTAPSGGLAAEREAVLQRSLTLLLAERELAARDDSVPELMRAEAALCFDCRRVTRLIDATVAAQPRGWRDEEREAARS